MLPLSESLSNMQFTSRAGYVWLVLSLVTIALLVTAWLRHSRFGAYLQAVRDNEDAALAVGVNPFRIKLGAIVLSGALMGAGGAFYAQVFQYIDPGLAFGPHQDGVGDRLVELLFALLPLTGKGPLFTLQLFPEADVGLHDGLDVLPEAGAARCESAATLRVIWITDDHCVSAFQTLRKLLQQSGSSRISICMILAGGAFRSPEQRGDAQRRMQAELAAAGAGEILMLDCGLLTEIGRAHV